MQLQSNSSLTPVSPALPPLSASSPTPCASRTHKREAWSRPRLKSQLHGLAPVWPRASHFNFPKPRFCRLYKGNSDNAYLAWVGKKSVRRCT